MPHDDFSGIEPIPGLPERPPAGEEILWQGRPNAFALARDSLALFWVAAYFVILAFWRFLTAVDLLPVGQAIAGTMPFLVMGAVVCGLLYVFALMQARATMYTVTSSRVVLRIGAALTVTLNVPYRELANASLDLRRNGTGTIALETSGAARLSYLVCWPHVRAWRFNPTQPALRAIPDAANVARILADAAQTRLAEPRISLAPIAAE